jgi:hypothetical protein
MVGLDILTLCTGLLELVLNLVCCCCWLELALEYVEVFFSELALSLPDAGFPV